MGNWYTLDDGTRVEIIKDTAGDSVARSPEWFPGNWKDVAKGKDEEDVLEQLDEEHGVRGR
jgi:hypothetical protein